MKPAPMRAARIVIAGILGLQAAACGTDGGAVQADAITVYEPHRTAAVETSFSFLQTVREMQDGRVLIADPLGRQLGLVDLQSGAVEPIGTEGEGPNEWRQPDAVHALPGDSTLLVDLGNIRLAVMDPEGALVHSYPLVLAPGASTAAPEGEQAVRTQGQRAPQGSGGGAVARQVGPGGGAATQILTPRALDSGGRVYFQGGRSMGPPARGAEQDSLEVRRWERGAASTERVAGLRPPALSSSSSGQGQFMVRPMPLALQDDWTVAPDGRVALVRAEPYRVEWLGVDGEVVSGPVVAYDPVPVRDAEKERWLEMMGSTGLAIGMSVENGTTTMNLRRGGGGLQRPTPDIGDYEWPASLPAFRSGAARVDPLGRVWVERYDRAGTPTLFDLFNERGQRTAQVRLPVDRRVVGFGANAVYAVRIDGLGLHWLEVYELPR